jgi:hypothetical protein
MDRQTQVRSNGVGESTGRRVVRNASELWHHVMLLGELQGRLLAVELGEGFRKARTGVLVAVVGVFLLLASFPVVLAAVALIIVETTSLTLAQAFGIVAGIALALSLILATGGWLYLRSQTLGVPRSQAEWSLNWHWMKETLRRERSLPPHMSDGNPSQRS